MKCKIKGCGVVLSKTNKHGMCVEHYNGQRDANARSCSMCQRRIKQANKSGTCLDCRTEKTAKTCLSCGHLYNGKPTKCGTCQSCRDSGKKSGAVILEFVQPQKPFTVDDLVHAASVITLTKPALIKGPVKVAWLYNIRHAIAHLAKDHYSLGHIGRCMNRDHTTIRSSVVKADEMINLPSFKTLVDNIRRVAMNAGIERRRSAENAKAA